MGGPIRHAGRLSGLKRTMRQTSGIIRPTHANMINADKSLPNQSKKGNLSLPHKTSRDNGRFHPPLPGKPQSSKRMGPSMPFVASKLPLPVHVSRAYVPTP
jgi:hypothetical protein